MTYRTWMGRLLARVTQARERAAWRGRRFVRLTLQALPDRDGPSSLIVVESGLLLASAGTPWAPHSSAAEPPPAATHQPGAFSVLPPTGDHHRGFAGVARPPATDDRSGTASELPRPAADFISFGSVDVPGPQQWRVSDPVFVGPNTPPRPQPAAAVIVVVPATPAEAPVFMPLQQVATTTEPDGVAVETPATFADGEVPVDDVLAEEVATDATGFPTSGLSLEEAAGSASPPGHPGRPVEAETLGASNVIVTPEPGVIGRPVQADTGVFRVTGTGEKMEVHYTLAAHGPGGTVSVDRCVTLPGGTNPVTVTPGPALAASQPQVLTILLRDQPGHQPARAAATLFLTPPGGRIGDSALFEAHRVGRSPEAFETLVQRHGPAVARACQRIVGNRADAEDVTQFVFLRLARWQGRFPDTLTGWLRTVSKNASLTLLRSRRRRLRHEREAAKPVGAEPPDATGLDESLDAAIRQLPATLGEAVRLRYLEGRSQQEAARLVGCPRGTLSRRAAHGIRVLRELLGTDRAVTG